MNERSGQTTPNYLLARRRYIEALSLEAQLVAERRANTIMAGEVERLRATIDTWCSGQLSTNDQMLAMLTVIQDRINEEIIAEINDPRNAVEPPAFRQGLRIGRIIVNRVIGEREKNDAQS